MLGVFFEAAINNICKILIPPGKGLLSSPCMLQFNEYIKGVFESTMKKLISAILVIVTLASMLAVHSIITVTATDGLPDVVDNSKSKYFPAILSQGDQGSCVAWAQAYYQFTYEMNKALDRESTSENCFSPSFVYNMSNYGEDTGCFPSTAFNNMKKFGVAPWSTIPYNKEIHRDWFPQESIWQEAAQYRIADFKTLPNFRTGSGKHVEHPDDPDLTQIKTLLSEGHLLSFGAYMNRWKESKIKTNPACPANEPFVGEKVITATSPDIGNGYGHRMTLVGYNDNIWVDVNGNNTIDNGEMGAFKVANSFGTWWGNNGFVWLAYDNINMTTSVAGGLPYRTMSGLIDVTAITVLPYNSDADIYIRYTLNTSDRQNMRATVIAEKDGKTYDAVAGPHHDAPYAKNIYSFDGTTSSNDGTLIFVLSNVVPGITSETLGDYKWSIKFEDTKADGASLTVKNAEIVDNSTGRAVKALGTFGYKLNGTSQTMTFPEIAPYIPPTTTTVPPTTTTEVITTEPAETTTTENITTDSTTITPTTTEVQTTTLIVPTTVYTEPTEVTTETEAVITIPATTTFPVTSTATTTQVPTAVTNPPVVSEHIYGDTNDSNSISISDATLIQKFVAYLIDADKLNLNNADCNSDGKVSVKDATCIQKYLAKLDGFGVTGEKYTTNIPVTNTTDATENVTTTTQTEAVTTTQSQIVTEPTEPAFTTEAETSTIPQPTTTESVNVTTDPYETTEAVITTVTTEPTTVAPTETQTQPATTEPITTEPATTEAVDANIVTFTNSFGWQGVISCYYWSDSNKTMTSWPGIPMQNAGTNSFGEALYTLEIPKDATYIIFTNGSVQTVDITYSGGEQKFYPVSPDNNGKYTVSNW